MLNFFQDIKQKIEKGVEQAGKSSQKVLEISRLNLKIKGKREDIEHTVNRLGWTVFQKWTKEQKMDVDHEVQQGLKAIQDLMIQLQNLERELEELKNTGNVSKEPPSYAALPPSPNKEAYIQMPNSSSVSIEATPVNPMPNPSQVQNPNQVQNPIQPSVSIIYICPFCAHQVPTEAKECAHCHQRFYS